MRFKRYAIYYTPAPEDPWARAASAWLGYDMASGAALPQPDLPDIARITEAPRHYGLHATLKPPFQLAKGKSVATLRTQLENFCTAAKPVPIGPIALTQLGRFLALTPAHQSEALRDFAGQIVRDFDQFRAPMQPAELARRDRPNLRPLERENLLQWGYPHVMDSFRFHITLTSRLGEPTLKSAKIAISEMILPQLSETLSLDALSLVGEPETGPFRLIDRIPLNGC